jgi:5-methylcytosine-specific restriction protein A
MTDMSKVELLLVLALYYFDKGKNIDKFTAKFNQYFKKDASAQTILYALSCFKNVDPSNNVSGNEKSVHHSLWVEYIEQDKLQELKELYTAFKKGAFSAPVEEKAQHNDIPARLTKPGQVVTIVDAPQERPKSYHGKDGEVYPRSKQVVVNALLAAQYQCEANCGTQLFKRKGSNTTYTEAHHLIPLCYQNEFAYSLDVEANVVSLCPNCHRQLHYGANAEELLKKLYLARCDRLKACGIEITYEKLLLLYR